MRNRLGHCTDVTDGCKLRPPSVHTCRLRAIKSEQSSHFTAGETEALRGEKTCPKLLRDTVDLGTSCPDAGGPGVHHSKVSSKLRVLPRLLDSNCLHCPVSVATKRHLQWVLSL